MKIFIRIILSHLLMMPLLAVNFMAALLQAGGNYDDFSFLFMLVYVVYFVLVGLVMVYMFVALNEDQTFRDHLKNLSLLFFFYFFISLLQVFLGIFSPTYTYISKLLLGGFSEHLVTPHAYLLKISLYEGLLGLPMLVWVLYVLVVPVATFLYARYRW